MEKRLNAKGVFTVEKLYSLSSMELRQIWGGINGERFYKYLRGEHFELDHQVNQSIGHSHVLPPEKRNMHEAYFIFNKLLNKAAIRLRKIQSWTQKISIRIRYTDGRRWGADVKLFECQDTLSLQAAADTLWNKAPKGAPLKLSITFSDFIRENERTLSLFENKKREDLSQIMDSLNQRFGKNSIFFGSIAESLDSAPNRIAFSNIPEAE
jgi:DNA polymerase-4